MFEQVKRQFPAFFIDNTTVYSGTEEAFNEQIAVPLMTGAKKNTYSNSDAEKVATAVTCIKVLGDTVSKLPINVYQKTDQGNIIDKEDYRYDLLHYSPDGIITSQSFFGALEYNRNLKGNAFALIKRDPLSGRAISLEFIPSNMVGGYKKVNGQLYYIVYYEGRDKSRKQKVVNSNDMLHFKMITKNSIWGINPIEVQRLNLSTIYKSKNTVDSYYENNAFTPKVLKSLIPDAQFQKPFSEAMKAWKAGGNLAGSMNAGTVATLPPFTEIQELSLDPIDQKFIESTKFDTTQIAAFYGVPPDMVGVWEYSKFANVEQAQLNFLTNTMSAILKMYRTELEMKLLTTAERKAGKSIEFVTQALFETDTATRVNYYTQLFNMGVLSGNQIAEKESLPMYEGGNIHLTSSQNVNVTSKNDVSTNIV